MDPNRKLFLIALTTALFGLAAAHANAASEGLARAGAGIAGVSRDVQADRCTIAQAQVTDAVRDLEQEIGRASCRERVENAVVALNSSRRRHTRYWRDWSSDVCSSDLKLFLIALTTALFGLAAAHANAASEGLARAGAGIAGVSRDVQADRCTIAQAQVTDAVRDLEQ